MPDARELAKWRRCAALGGSARTLEVISRLPPNAVRSFIFAGAPVHKGRTSYRDPLSFQSDSARAKVELTSFFAQYQKGRAAGIDPLDCLIHGYERSSSLFVQPIVKFDHCFLAVSQLEGMWLAQASTLKLLPCRKCYSLVLTSRTRVHTYAETCPMCAWLADVAKNASANQKFQTQPMLAREADDLPPDPRVELNALVLRLRSFTSDARVIARVINASPYASLMDPALQRHLTLPLRKPLTLERLEANIDTIDHLQYSLLLAAYSRYRSGSVPAYLALLEAYNQLQTQHPFLRTVPFVRAFEFVAQFDGDTWGASTRLTLRVCESCAREIARCVEGESQTVCPFCRVHRRPGVYVKWRWTGIRQAAERASGATPQGYIDHFVPEKVPFLG